MLAEPNGGSACACHPERRALSATSAGLEGAAISKPRAVDLMGDRVRVRTEGKPVITAALPARHPGWPQRRVARRGCSPSTAGAVAVPLRGVADVQDCCHQVLQGADEVLFAQHHGAVTGTYDVDRAAWSCRYEGGTLRTCSISSSQRRGLSAAAGGYSSGPARPRGLAAQRPPAPGTVLSVPPAGQPPPGTTVVVTAALPHPDTAMGTITGNGDGQGDGPGNQPSARADSPRMPPSRPAGGRRWAQARVHPPVRWAAP